MASLSPSEWEDWTSVAGLQQHRDRFPLFRSVRYEPSEPTGEEGVMARRAGAAITVNVSNGGICLLMDWAPALQEVMRLHVPMPDNLAHTPTLAEARWVRPLPFDPTGIFLVGLKFIF